MPQQWQEIKKVEGKRSVAFIKDSIALAFAQNRSDCCPFPHKGRTLMPDRNGSDLSAVRVKPTETKSGSQMLTLVFVPYTLWTVNPHRRTHTQHCTWVLSILPVCQNQGRHLHLADLWTLLPKGACQELHNRKE
ncbi:hypothetical protein Bbelb_037410 [Branchiostoma belcheri]|nr:hypothetical protein Bbelb_037410 [Branchiostoma belcheri]